MTEYSIFLEWQRDTPDFHYSSYTRNHTVIFGMDGKVNCSASPDFYGNPQYLDPEQAFITSLSSCHMLTFLAIASNKGYIIDKYSDKAIGEIGKNKTGRSSMTLVLLRPVVVFSGEKIPSIEEFQIMHDRAHNGCIIANSISECVELVIEPSLQKV